MTDFTGADIRFRDVVVGSGTTLQGRAERIDAENVTLRGRWVIDSPSATIRGLVKPAGGGERINVGGEATDGILLEDWQIQGPITCISIFGEVQVQIVNSRLASCGSTGLDVLGPATVALQNSTLATSDGCISGCSLIDAATGSTIILENATMTGPGVLFRGTGEHTAIVRGVLHGSTLAEVIAGSRSGAQQSKAAVAGLESAVSVTWTANATGAQLNVQIQNGTALAWLPIQTWSGEDITVNGRQWCLQVDGNPHGCWNVPTEGISMTMPHAAARPTPLASIGPLMLAISALASRRRG